MTTLKTGALALTMSTLLLALPACIETTSPVCNSSNRVDVAGLARIYTASLLADPTQNVQDSSLTVTHVGVGQYQVQSPNQGPSQVETISTCSFGPWTLAEDATEYGTYEQNVLSVALGGVTSLNALLTDQTSLSSAGISSQIVTRTVSSVRRRWMKLAGRDQQTEKVLLINTNSPQAQNSLSALIKPMAVGLGIY